MKKFFLKRLIGFIPLLLGISVITFFVIHLAPGDPTSLQTDLNPKVSLQAKQKMMELYHLDRPLLEQYGLWLKRMAFLDFGLSFKDGQSVIKKIRSRIPVTLLISVLSFMLILLISIPLGVLSAIKEETWIDKGITIFVYIGFAVPTFWLALLLMSAFGVKWHILPVSGLHSLEYEFMNWAEKIVDTAWHLVLPLFVSAFTGLAAMSRYMRTSMLEVIHQDYIKTAWSKGLKPSVVIYKHALRNAILPIVTLLGLSVPALLGGSVIFETIFSIPGMGRLFYDSVMARDYPVIMGILMVGALLTLIGNLLADMAYTWADPRIRYEKR
jgi:peptide/nickel transport system permease protein